MGYRIKMTKKEARKGMSNVMAALILIIAAVIVSLVVIGFNFGLFGSYAGSAGSFQTGTAIIIGPNLPSYDYLVIVTLHSSGNVEVISAMLAGVSTRVTPVSSTLTQGANTITITIPMSDLNATLQAGATYTLVLTLSNSKTVLVAALYEGPQKISGPPSRIGA